MGTPRRDRRLWRGIRPGLPISPWPRTTRRFEAQQSDAPSRDVLRLVAAGQVQSDVVPTRAAKFYEAALTFCRGECYDSCLFSSIVREGEIARMASDVIRQPRWQQLARHPAIFAWLGLAGCAAVPPPVSYVGPAVSPAEEHRALALFQDRAGQFRQAAEQRLRGVGARLLAAMDVARPVPFQILDSHDVNAYVRDGTVYVTRGMIRFVQNEDELALVLGHEVGHVVLDAQAEAGRLSPEDRERLADYHALVGLHRAGYKISTACEVWQRMATEVALHAAGGQARGQVQWMATHPSFAERYVRAQKVAESLLDGSLPLTLPARSPGLPAASSVPQSLR